MREITIKVIIDTYSAILFAVRTSPSLPIGLALNAQAIEDMSNELEWLKSQQDSLKEAE